MMTPIDPGGQGPEELKRLCQNLANPDRADQLLVGYRPVPSIDDKGNLPGLDRLSREAIPSLF